MDAIISVLAGAGLSSAEWFVVWLIVIGLPIEGEIALRLYKPRILAGVPKARLYTYFYAIASLWAFALAVLFVWSMGGRDWAALGVRFTPDIATLITCALSAFIIGYFSLQLWQIRKSPDLRAQYRAAFGEAGGAHYFMPRTHTDYRTFALLGVTAGITEEIIFRGFLIWAFATLMPEWGAAILSLALFVFAHRYQGTQGLIQVTIAGAILTGLYLASGSLYPVIAVHIAVDVLNNAIIWRARQTEEET